MAKGGSRLLIGCGVGCGVILLIGGLLVGSGAFWVRDITQEFGNAVELRAQLDERHGAPADWVPPADGSIPPERLETFLAMRAASEAARERIAATMSVFAMTDDKIQQLEHGSWLERTREVWRITRTGFELPSALGEYFMARNQALLDHGMGYGEYAFLYAQGYWSFLGIDPFDGPDQIRRGDDDSDDDVATISVRRDGNSVAVQPGVMRRVRADLLSMLRNQLAVCQAAADCEPGWLEALSSEVSAMTASTDRLPWPSGLPEPVANSLEPFRARLAASYNEATNPFELARNKQHGSWSIQSE